MTSFQFFALTIQIIEVISVINYPLFLQIKLKSLQHILLNGLKVVWASASRVYAVCLARQSIYCVQSASAHVGSNFCSGAHRPEEEIALTLLHCCAFGKR